MKACQGLFSKATVEKPVSSHAQQKTQVCSQNSSIRSGRLMCLALHYPWWYCSPSLALLQESCLLAPLLQST